MATWVPDRGGSGEEALPVRAGRWAQRLLFYTYLLVVLAVFGYPLHYLASSGERVSMGRYILFTAPQIYQPDSVQMIREVMLVTVIFLVVIHLLLHFLLDSD